MAALRVDAARCEPFSQDQSSRATSNLTALGHDFTPFALTGRDLLDIEAGLARVLPMNSTERRPLARRRNEIH
jgi:hypothetical protein